VLSIGARAADDVFYPCLDEGNVHEDKRHLSDSACDGENESAGHECPKHVRFYTVNETKSLAILLSRVTFLSLRGTCSREQCTACCRESTLMGKTEPCLLHLFSLLCMVVPSTAGEAPVQPIAVWANQTQNSACLLGMDSPRFGATEICSQSWAKRPRRQQ